MMSRGCLGHVLGGECQGERAADMKAPMRRGEALTVELEGGLCGQSTEIQQGPVRGAGRAFGIDHVGSREPL